ncbi:T9SS type A sorting domain-containing protein [Algoriphagus zhangzhouensis]|uniref:Por secretion system C-terminal sorting domain-containing protein n=1 Tax=Algoriphagus zhangzhouensis TaxID=1073327 RepID=A0A1M7Z991_9BACT|nr:T9SS type A sorting domain-containing protein [Algoriphagus zhangzhouensis]TDY47498.1 putative secreted protein (Por secretion system target) [Algoriphagus zhangzhouensis]SHO61389.1 Por secretion system C-terminal sorting domain-containing protein [Algoriphagus zhangzhouensis]
MRLFLVGIFLFVTSVAFSQKTFTLDSHPSIQINGETLSSPFSGGINSAQIQTIDLNGDGQDDWVVWDINSRQLTIFEKEGEEWLARPEWAYFFPDDISGFLALADYDGDGKKDLFTSTALGIKVYKNTSSGNSISWELARNFLPLENGSNIQANNLDTPLIRDLDGDGDLDLVIFNFAAGDYLEFYKNTSVERNGSPDIDGFESAIPFWGNFTFCGCENVLFGKSCSGQDLRVLENENSRIQHAGGHSILYRDFNGDGISDLVLGRDECQILFFLPNEGTETTPLFTSFSHEIPGLGDLPTFPIFHNPNWIDDQFIISLNSNEAAQTYGIDYENSVFTFDGKIEPILQNQTLDLGENSKPFFSGNKNGGYLFVTSNVTREGSALGEIAEFTFSNNQFDLTNRNQEIRSLGLWNIQYLEPLDNLGNPYPILTGQRWEQSIPRQIIFTQVEGEWQERDISGYNAERGDYIQFFEYQNQHYLLVAGQNGALDLYEMNFSILEANLIEENFLDFSDNPSNRNLSIAVVEGESPNLYAVDQRGILVFIENFMENTQREEVQIEVGEESFSTRLGRNTWIAVVSPVLGNDHDLILGTRAGGLLYLTGVSSPTSPSEESQLIVFPNPSDGPIKIVSNQSGTGRLITSLGQVLLDKISITAGQEVEIQSGFLTPGLYIFQMETSNGSRIAKKVWIR